MSCPSGPGSRASFPTTHWSVVAQVAGASTTQAREALDLLCRAYWFPIYAFIRRKGHDPESSRDLTQAYFQRLLEKDLVLAADPDKGRFRAFLKTDCTFFLADHRDREQARKRGGDRTRIPIECLDAEDRYAREVADHSTPERLFDRAWAVTLLDHVLERLATEYADSARRALFERLQVVLTGGPRVVQYAKMAEDVGTTEGPSRSPSTGSAAVTGHSSGKRSPRPSTPRPRRMSRTRSANCSPRSLDDRDFARHPVSSPRGLLIDDRSP